MLSWGGLGGRSPPRNLRYPSFVVVRRRRRHPPEIGRFDFGRKIPGASNDSYLLNTIDIYVKELKTRHACDFGTNLFLASPFFRACLLLILTVVCKRSAKEVFFVQSHSVLSPADDDDDDDDDDERRTTGNGDSWGGFAPPDPPTTTFQKICPSGQIF